MHSLVIWKLMTHDIDWMTQLAILELKINCNGMLFDIIFILYFLKSSFSFIFTNCCDISAVNGKLKPACRSSTFEGAPEQWLLQKWAGGGSLKHIVWRCRWKAWNVEHLAFHHGIISASRVSIVYKSFH